ncbi:MAG: hypothetical protein IPO94_16385, partial [Saprospiraceae bacterium]|nr:hypothetical protein [Saprospiraceae bacterium]
NIGSEVILVRSENLDLLFQQIDVPNYMRTTDPRMIDNQFRFFENIRKISTHITMTGEKSVLNFSKNCEKESMRYPNLQNLMCPLCQNTH